MNICLLVQAMLAMYAAHQDTPSNQQEIANRIKWGQDQCAELQKKEAKAPTPVKKDEKK